MTIRGVGKPVPSQLFLMQMAGLVVQGWAKVRDPTTEQIETSKQDGYEALKKLTGQDFGYDVKAWYKYLVSNADTTGVKHPYGYSTLLRFLKNNGFEISD